MINTRIGWRKACLQTSTAILLALSVAACTGSGGGGGGNSGGGGSGGGGSSSGNADAFRTQEFLASGGLDQIRAAEGFAQITGAQGGEGVRIAVIGSGIDTSHPDLNVAQTGVFLNEAVRVDTLTTAMAGAAAARAGNGGVQGVAFNADLVDLQADTVLQPGILDTGRVRRSVLAAAGEPAFDPDGLFESDVILLGYQQDLEFGLDQDTGLQAFSAAFTEATNRDKVIVASTGTFIPGNGSQFDTLTANLFSSGAISVASVDANNQLSDNSLACGVTFAFCVVAPGENIISTVPGGGTAAISSSAIAAGFVAGAAAVIKAAFPGISRIEVRNRIITTATDLGAPGLDQTFGAGLLNLENALTPQGSLSVTTSNSLDDSGFEINTTSLALGSGFALDNAGEDLLAKAVVFDDQDFPFGFDLNGAQDVQNRSTGLSSFVATGDSIGFAKETPYGTLSFAAADTPLATNQDLHDEVFFSSETALQAQALAPQLKLTSGSGDSFSTFVSLNGSSQTDAGLSKALAANQAELFQEGSFFSAFEGIAGKQSGTGASYEVTETTKLSVSAFTSAEREDEAGATLQKIELTQKTFGDVELRLGYGWLQEDGSFLGSQSDGAFGTATSGESQFMTASVLAPLTDDVSVFGSYTRGDTTVSTGSASLLSDWSTAKVEAFGIGMVTKDLATSHDRLTLMAGQPLRVDESSATLTVPVGRTEDGGVVTESGRVDLAPEGREIALEAIYSFDVSDDGDNLALGTFVRLNPDHDPNADPDAGIGLRYRMSW